MRLLRNVRLLVCGLFGSLLVLAASSAAQADDWGTIKGQVVFGGATVPARVMLKVDKDPKECLAKGPILSEEWVVDPKTKGVKWVYVWLVKDSKKKDDLTKAIPTHPDLKKRKLVNVKVDQPCCMFEPYCIALQEGQSLEMHNSMDIAHNVKIDGNPDVGNPVLNQLLPPGAKIPVGPFKAQATPVPVACNVHGWMSGYIRVFSHPYFMVTKEDGKFEIKDAPAGKYRLVIWHPGAGWVAGEKGEDPSKFGVPIEIKANGTTDLGTFKVMMPK